MSSRAGNGLGMENDVTLVGTSWARQPVANAISSIMPTHSSRIPSFESIGKAYAQLFASRGAKVVVNDLGMCVPWSNCDVTSGWPDATDLGTPML